jgi:hypothetical protein
MTSTLLRWRHEWNQIFVFLGGHAIPCGPLAEPPTRQAVNACDVADIATAEVVTVLNVSQLNGGERNPLQHSMITNNRQSPGNAAQFETADAVDLSVGCADES